jgi:hypothetical protein
MMLGTLQKIIDRGFDGELLFAEIEKATLHKPYNSKLILSETTRCAAWCHGQVCGNELATVTAETFHDCLKDSSSS